jgi:hypothetical protein
VKAVHYFIEMTIPSEAMFRRFQLIGLRSKPFSAFFSREVARSPSGVVVESSRLAKRREILFSQAESRDEQSIAKTCECKSVALEVEAAL